MTPPISHEEFFNSLSALLTATTERARGSTYLTQKPLLHSEGNKRVVSTRDSLPPILIRVTDGRTSNPNSKPKDSAAKKQKQKQPKLKLSTVVDQNDLEVFYTRYAEVCKGAMTGLKKRDRKKLKAKKGGGAKVLKS